jgi:hypothetical protein
VCRRCSLHAEFCVYSQCITEIRPASCESRSVFPPESSQSVAVIPVLCSQQILNVNDCHAIAAVNSRDFPLNLHHNRLECSTFAHCRIPSFDCPVSRTTLLTGEYYSIRLNCQHAINQTGGILKNKSQFIPALQNCAEATAFAPASDSLPDPSESRQWATTGPAGPRPRHIAATGAP